MKSLELTPGLEWQLQRLAQATVADTGSGSNGSFSADPTTARDAEHVPWVAYGTEIETAELPRPQPLRPSQSPLLGIVLLTCLYHHEF